MPKTKTAKAPRKTKKAAEDPAEARERHTAEKVMQTVLAEQKAESEVVRIDQWISVECPHCGESSELHVIADMDGQSLDQDCGVCCRPYIAHIDIEEGDVNVGVEAS